MNYEQVNLISRSNPILELQNIKPTVTFAPSEEEVNITVPSTFNPLHPSSLPSISMQNWRSLFPAIKWIQEYNWKTMLQGDIISGLTVGIMLIPQALAYSSLSLVPPQYGLYSSSIPLLVYGLLANSRHLATGPAAIIALLVSQRLKFYESEEDRIKISIMMAFATGLVTILFAIFRLGIIARFLSHSVLTGFISGAATIVVFSQFSPLFGLRIPSSRFPLYPLFYTLLNVSNIKLTTALMSFASLGMLLLLRKLKSLWDKWKPVRDLSVDSLIEEKRFKLKIALWQTGKMIISFSSLLTLVGATIISYFLYEHFGYTTENLGIVGKVPCGPPEISVPALWEDIIPIEDLLISSLIVAIIGFVESIAIAEIYSRKENYEIRANQELVALGFSNFISSFFSSFPTTGSISRSAINYDSGAKTPLAGIISGLVALISSVSITSSFYYVPKCALSSVILISVLPFFNLKTVRECWYCARSDFYLILSTFLSTILLGVEVGLCKFSAFCSYILAIGFVISIFLVIQKAAFTPLTVLGQIYSHRSNQYVYRNIIRFPHASKLEGIEILRIDAPLWFANSKSIHDQVFQLVTSTTKCVILECSGMDSLDISGIESLLIIQTELNRMGISLILSETKGPIRDMIKQYNDYIEGHVENGLVDGTNGNLVTATVREAVLLRLGDTNK